MASINLQSKDGGGDSSSRSPVRSRGVSSPWSKIVRGDSVEFPSPVVSVDAPAASPSSSSVQEQIVNPSDWYSSKAVPEAAISPDDSGTECQPEGSDNGGGGSHAFKKAVWSKPSNGVVEAVSPVMGAVSWPALGESTKASPKSSSSESLQALSDGSLLPALQVTGNSLPSSHRLASANNMNPTSTNHVPAGHRSVKRGGGNSSAYVSANGGVFQPPPTGQDSVAETQTPRNTSGKPGPVAMESYPRDHTHKELQRGGFGPQSNSGTDHHPQRNSYRRGNGGQHPRGDGAYHHNYGSKMDQGRGNQEWNQHRNVNRDTNVQPQRGFRRSYMRPSVHTSTPFIPPPLPVPVRPFGNNVMYPDMASGMIYVQGPPPPSESLRSMPLVAPIPAPMYFTVPDPHLHAKIVNQIDYYFSNENLVKDTYLRQNMDEQGWVPVNLIAGFKKVLNLTDNVQLILDAMRTSTVVEVQGDKMRRRNDWMRWLMPPPTHLSNVSSPEASGSGRPANQDTLAAQLQGMALENQVETYSSRSSSGEFGTQLQQAGGEGGVQMSSQQASFEHTTVA